MDHRRYIDEILPVALKYGNEGFGDNWIFQQDGAKPHTHASTQEWCPLGVSAFPVPERSVPRNGNAFYIAFFHRL